MYVRQSPEEYMCARPFIVLCWQSRYQQGSAGSQVLSGVSGSCIRAVIFWAQNRVYQPQWFTPLVSEGPVGTLHFDFIPRRYFCAVDLCTLYHVDKRTETFNARMCLLDAHPW